MSNTTRIEQGHRERWHEVRHAVRQCAVLAVACLVSYLLATNIISHVHFLSREDELIGGLWAVIATVFVLRDSYQHSMTAALSRIMATLVSFALCLIYLAFLPFHPWALAVLVGGSALAATLIGRPGDAISAAIATTVLLVGAAVSPQQAWQQPILRLADTVIGVAIGVAAAWLELRVTAFVSPAKEGSPVKEGSPAKEGSPVKEGD